jgi:hypothetical protein
MPLVREEEFCGTERFAVQRRLGAGAFGVVYEVFDRERGSIVALKALRGGNVEGLYRLKQEFRALADISHPNLVTLHELLAHGDQWFFTMELVDGVNFLEYVRRGFEPVPGGLSEVPTISAGAESGMPPEPVSRFPGRFDRIRATLRQAVSGLQALHAAGKLHRDIKPSNVLVTREGRLVLLDFGLVKELGRPGSEDRSLVGTPAYMSPEQGSGRPVTEASDWYSLGVMLYEALTGSWPFGGTFAEMVWDKRHAEPPAPREVAFDVPEDLNDLCRDLLRSDPATRPTGEEILARLGGVQAAIFERPTPSLARAPGPAFVGRESHLATLRSAFQAIREGRSVIVRLHGASGTGKTALARHFLAQLEREGAVVLAGRCYERESVPYKALDSLVDALSQYLKRLPPAEATEILPRDVLALARLFPVLRRVESIAGARRKVLEIPDSQELRRRAFAALRELLGRLAEQRDVVLFLDDLQWGDVDSAALLTELLRAPQPPPLLVIACYRSEEAETSPFLQRMFGSAIDVGLPEVWEVVVGELTPPEARELAHLLLSSEAPGSEAEAEEIARESAGSPFFIVELTRYAQAGLDVAERVEAVRRRGSDAAAGRATLEEVLQGRVQALPEPARLLLEMLSVAGQPLPADVAGQAARLDDTGGSLAVLRTRHLVRTRTTRERKEIEPYHDRIRENVVAHLPPETLKSHHLRLATALEGFPGTDPETLALHFQEAGDDASAADYAAAAADRAAEALAFYRSARLYRLALELTDPRQPTRRELSVKLGDALSNAGRGAEAAEAYLRAVVGGSAAEALELRRRAAEQFLISGHIEEGLSAIAAVLEGVGLKLARSPRGALLSMLFRRLLVRIRGIRFRERDATQIPAEKLTRIDICWSAAKGLGFSDPLRGNDFQARQLLLALGAGEPYRVARALATEAGYSAMRGGRSRDRTERLLAAAMSIAKRIGHPHAIGFTMSVAGIAAYLEGRWATARKLAEEAGVVLRERCRAVAWELDNAHYYSLVSLLNLGKFRELRKTLPALLKEAHDRGDLYFATNMRTRFSWVLRLAQDEPRQAQEELQQAIERWSSQAFHLQHWYELSGQVESFLYAGEAVTARRHLDDRWPLLKSSLLLRVQIVLLNSLYLRARCAIATALASEGAAERRASLRIAEKDARRMEREHMPWGDALARLVRACVAAARGERERAASELESAEKALRDTDMALHAGAAQRRRGELLGGAEGARLIEASSAWMTGQSIENPARMAAMLAPGTGP